MDFPSRSVLFGLADEDDRRFVDVAVAERAVAVAAAADDFDANVFWCLRHNFDRDLVAEQSCPVL